MPSKALPKEVLIRYVSSFVFPTFDEEIRKKMKSMGYHVHSSRYRFPGHQREFVFVKSSFPETKNAKEVH